MIEIKNISKHFGKLEVLKQVNLHFSKGECVALLGPNGSGKTTLVKSILGMVLPSSGEIFFDGKSIYKDWHYRENIGYMPQIGRYPENLSIGQVFELMQDIRRDFKGEKDSELIHSLQLDTMMDKKMRTLSGGTRQKVSAALAFLFNPEVLFLDEPTAGLDPESSLILKSKIIQAQHSGKLILITSHVLSELDQLVNRIVFIQDGNILFNDSLEELHHFSGKSNLTEAIAHIMKNRHG